MRFKQSPIPGGRLRAGRKGLIRRSIRSKVSTIPPAEVHRGYIEFFQVPLADKTRAVKRLIPDSRPVDRRSARRELRIGRLLPEVSESTHTLQSEATCLESPARSNESIVSLAGQVSAGAVIRAKGRTSVIGIQEGHRHTSAVVLRVPHPFQSN